MAKAIMIQGTMSNAGKSLLAAGLDVYKRQTRIRPILMTSMTTILAMIPMALAIGSSGSTTQGLAIVDIGGLSVGVIVALFMVPVYYALLSRKPKDVYKRQR